MFNKHTNKKNKIMDIEMSIHNHNDDHDICDSIIDYVLVYNSNSIDNEHELTNSNTKKKSKLRYRRNFLENLKSSGLEIIKYKLTKYDKTVYVLIHTPFSKLLEIAEKTKLKLPIEINDLGKKTSIRQCCKKFTNLLELPPEISQDKEADFFTAPYSSTLHDKFSKFFNKDDIEKTICPKDRSLLTYEILCRTIYSEIINESNENFINTNNSLVGIERLLANGVFLAAYPLHDRLEKKTKNIDFSNSRQLLWDYWANPKRIFKYQPLHIICKYFGEKIAFYFAWLGFYTSWLLLPSIVGIFVLIYGFITLFYDIPTKDICDKNGLGNRTMCPLCNMDYCEQWKLYESCFYSKLTYLVDNPATVIFSVVMAVWTVLFIEFWKRKQSYLQFEWDIEDFEKKIESVRPEFELKAKKKKKNPVTGLEEPYVPLRIKYLKYFLSFTTVVFMILVVVAFLFGIILYRIVLSAVLYKSDTVKAFSGAIISVTAGIINLIIIIIMGRFYSWLAVKLTDMEFHRTDSEYEDSLTVKMYLFQFVNFYGSIFYIAFFKGRNFSNKIGDFDLQEQCNPSGCLIELCIQLAIIMVGKQILNNLQEIFIPLMMNKLKRLFKEQNIIKCNRWINDFNLQKWSHLSLFDEYLEMVIQLGFITLFVVAFPLGPLFSFLNNIIEIRVDAYKVLTQYRRPLAKKAQNIGIWLTIINTLSRLGVITNGFIIAFTSDFVPRLVYQFGNYNGDNSLNGYLNFSLSVKNLQDFGSNSNNSEICSYRDLREPYDSPFKYEFTKDYYIVLCARLIFVVIFEHVVFFVVSLINWLVPDVPEIVQDQIERENLLVQQAIWEVKPDVFDKLRCDNEAECYEEDNDLNYYRQARILSRNIETNFNLNMRSRNIIEDEYDENIDEEDDKDVVIGSEIN